MNEPEYAQTPSLRLQRRASLALVLLSVLRNLLIPDGGFGIRRHAVLVIPLALIWYADDLATKAVEQSGGWLAAHNADVVIRVGGWTLLILILMVSNIDLIC